NQCASLDGDPICLRRMPDWPGGYCSEFCDVAAPDCPDDAVCADLGLSVHGVCLKKCAVDADCRTYYACVDNGLTSKVCYLDPTPGEVCDDGLDNDGDNRMDCYDPDCQALPACAPGPGPVGSHCTQSNECAANAYDPICFSEANWFFPGGFCSEFCDPL